MTSEFEEFLDEQLKNPEVRHAYLHSKAMTKQMLRDECERFWVKAETAYEEGIQRGRRYVEDPTRFPIKRADYTTMTNPQREATDERQDRPSGGDAPTAGGQDPHAGPGRRG